MKTKIYTILIVIFATVITTCAAELRTWTSKSGSKVNASLESKSGNYLKLKKEDGSIFKISLYKLSKADQDYVKSLTKPKNTAKSSSKTPTDGTVTVSVTTKTLKDKYAPKHFVAIWVTDDNNRIVKPLLLIGSKKSQVFLKKWKKAAKKLEVDAKSGATLKAHRTHTVTWDCKTAKGETAPDGTYNIMIEYAEGPKAQSIPNDYLSFKKGPEPVSVNPEDRKYMTGISLKYTPSK